MLRTVHCLASLLCGFLLTCTSTRAVFRRFELPAGLFDDLNHLKLVIFDVFGGRQLQACHAFCARARCPADRQPSGGLASRRVCVQRRTLRAREPRREGRDHTHRRSP